MSGSRRRRDDSGVDSDFDARLAKLLDSVERMASGDLDLRISLSERHDTIDALGHAINVLVGDLQHLTKGLRRAKEQAEAANLAKTVFLRNVSHELRTPLTVVLGLSELISSNKFPESRTKEFHERIVRKGRALVGILDDLQDLARVEAEKLELQLRPLSAGDLIAEVVSDFEHQAAKKGVRLVVEPAQPDARAMADEKHLRQILTNLIGNAVKFTEQGHIIIRSGREVEAQSVWVEVSDTGIGISEDQTGSLFEPFMQADASIAERFGGTGLGLALSRRLAEGMGGSLALVDSEPCAGTTFRLTLPAARVEGAVRKESLRMQGSGSELRGQRVLVVDDNDEVRAVTSELLRMAGASVVEAADGEEAIAATRESSFHSILMDLRMPRLDGLEATRRLREEGIAAPIIALTAYATAEQREACLDAGCSDYLTKPIDQDHLVTLLGRGRGPVPTSP